MTNKTPKQILGKKGEDVAANYLINKGYKIIERNFRAGHGEIDIIALDGNDLVFVEVKTSKSNAFGNPVSWVDEKKQRIIGETAEAFIYQKEYIDTDCRFDVIAIECDKGLFQIQHIKDAFWLE
jgi:putative endonuclease